MYELLIAEDEYLVRSGIKSLIDYEKMGIQQVYEAEDGEVAWQLFQQYHPKIVLTDINMPHLDGIELAKRIKSVQPDTHIIFLTGYDYFDYAISAIKMGVDDYILKPITRKELEARLTQTVQALEREARQHRIDSIIPIISAKSQSNLAKTIREELSNPSLSLTYIAELVGFNPNYLSTVIKRELGMSFQDFVLTERMERAKILLLSSDKKIYEIAIAVGFDDVHYFSARFKQYEGVTPKAYRNGVVS